MNAPQLTLKNLRQAARSQSWSATLCVDGKAAAILHDDGRGAPLRVDWSPSGGTPQDAGPVAARVEAYIATLPAVPTGLDDGSTTEPTLHIVVESIIERMLEERKVRRWCRSSVVVRVHTDEPGKFRRHHIPPTAENLARVREHYEAQDEPFKVLNKKAD